MYIFRNGHMLRTGGELPTLEEWPKSPDVTTFCGLDVYGMGDSVLYRMER